MSRDPLHDFAARGARAQEAVDELLGKPTRATKAKACVVCGCTDESACVPHGCMWIILRPPLCSGCFAFLMNIRDGSKLYQTLKHFGLNTSDEVIDLVDPSMRKREPPRGPKGKSPPASRVRTRP